MEILVWVMNVFGILGLVYGAVSAIVVIWIFKRIFRD